MASYFLSVVAAGPAAHSPDSCSTGPEGSLQEAGTNNEVSPKPRSLEVKLKSTIKTDLEPIGKQQAGAKTWGNGQESIRTELHHPLNSTLNTHFQPRTVTCHLTECPQEDLDTHKVATNEVKGSVTSFK